MTYPLSARLKKPRHLSALALALLAGCGSSGSDNDSGTPTQASLKVTSVSSPQGMASGGDSLIQVSDAAGGAVDNVVVRMNGQDVTAAFKKTPNSGALLGTVTGMSNGENRIEVLDAANPSVVRASLTLTNYPLQGPILYAPQEQPIACETHNFTVYPGGPQAVGCAGDECRLHGADPRRLGLSRRQQGRHRGLATLRPGQPASQRRADHAGRRQQGALHRPARDRRDQPRHLPDRGAGRPGRQSEPDAR